ncbi:hypothetical protein RR46_03500 [Papilio xuthus]|uniref:Uncharacterized protein n=1 Tax=Papilio xuthus TaxID=66420 RepID=A0A194QDD8_PAPXU|nr:hypothetical protein RR46_03500 [Papilio xuthus]
MRSGVVLARQCTPPRRDCSAWMSLMVPDGGDYPQRASCALVRRPPPFALGQPLRACSPPPQCHRLLYFHNN